MNKLTIPQTGSVTADNATDNNTLMDALEVLLQEHGFRGPARRVRCFAHTLNLTAKATLRQFEKIKKGRNVLIIMKSLITMTSHIWYLMWKGCGHKEYHHCMKLCN